jgi:hypothetical protein
MSPSSPTGRLTDNGEAGLGHDCTHLAHELALKDRRARAHIVGEGCVCDARLKAVVRLKAGGGEIIKRTAMSDMGPALATTLPGRRGL